MIKLDDDELNSLSDLKYSREADLYLVEKNIIYRAPPESLCRAYPTKWEIRKGTILAAHVAFTRGYIVTSNGLDETAFPLGLGRTGSIPNNILALPITQPDGVLLGVYEFTDSENEFIESKIKIALGMTAWMAAIFPRKEERLRYSQRSIYNRELVAEVNKYFHHRNSFERFVSLVLLKLKKVTKSSEILFYKSVWNDDTEFEVFEEFIPKSNRWMKLNKTVV